MAVYLDSYAVEMEFAGVGAGWTVVTADVRWSEPVTWGYGIRGYGPTDRVASTGQFTCAMDNSAENSAGLVGYYSPDHANARTGFDVGIRVRVRLTYNAVTYTRFIGRIGSISPLPGSRAERKTLVVAYDWMDEAARFKLDGIPTQLSKRSDEVIDAILDAMPIAPESVTLATGQDTYSYALDSSRDESSYALEEFQRVAQSEAGFVFLTGAGGLVFQSRHTRPAVSANAYTFDNTMIDITALRDRDLVINRVQAVAHPRSVDGSVVTLYTLQSVTEVRPGSSAVIFGGYVDPNQRAARVGGFDMVAPVATTDYTMNAAADGSSTNLTASFTVSTSFGGNGHYTTFTNNSADIGYITFFRVRGKGIYDYENAAAIAENTTSQTTYGANVLTVDMPYQNDVSVARGFANYVLNAYGTPRTYATSVRVLGNVDATHMEAALVCDIGSRIGLEEDVIGIASTYGGYAIGYFVQAIDCELAAGGFLTITMTVTPAGAQPFWVLGTSALVVDTGLGYL